MRLPTKSGFAAAAILAGSFGFASATQAPLAGVAAAVPAVQLTQQPSVMEALPEKAHHRPLYVASVRQMIISAGWRGKR